MQNLEIIFKDNKTWHSDIILEILKPKQKRRVDSYYLVLDSAEQTIDGAKRVLIKLLRYWLDTVNDLNRDEVKFLPIDFSDQYLGVFQIQLSDESELNFEYGYTLEIEGYAILPSAPQSVNTTEIKFKKDSKAISFKMRKEDFIEDIEQSIYKIELQLV